MSLVAAPAVAPPHLAGPEPAPARLVSLDAFRGLTIASMILVNNPGSWSAIHWPLAHAAWHGWTPTDLIFPFFLFMVGMALPFSRRTSLAEALRRAAALVGLGLFMAAFPRFDLATVRIPGVLQRIGLCYLAAWLAYRHLRVRGQAALAAALLLAYWGLMTLVPVPDGHPPNLEPATNLGAWLDRAVFGPHLWRQSKTWDPEGLLSTVPAVGTTLVGLLAGEWLRGRRPGHHTSFGLVAGGTALTLLGLLWGWLFPLNKSLWTSSYAVFTAGLGVALFGLCHYVADVVGHRGWTRPWVVYGRNAIFVFVASGLFVKAMALVKVPGPTGAPVPVLSWLHEQLFTPFLAPKDASLAFALANVLAWFVVLWVMDRRGVYLKV